MNHPRGWYVVATLAILALATATWLAPRAPAQLPAAPTPAGPSLPSRAPDASAPKPNQYTVVVVSERPHEYTAFTQGLLFDQGLLFESTGLYSHSTLREVDPSSGSVLRKVELPDSHFAEGLALVGNRLIQLTWREGIAHVYDRHSFAKIGEFRYEGEGWGLAYDGTHLVMSDGSDRLFFRNPDTFDIVTSVGVTLRGQPVPFLNELEVVPGGGVFANVLGQDAILEIDPRTGIVTGVIDASSLYPRSQRDQQHVLNGIAYDANAETFFLTGKMWPKVFEVQLAPRN